MSLKILINRNMVITVNHTNNVLIKLKLSITYSETVEVMYPLVLNDFNVKHNNYHIVITIQAT